jgi:hypothetical protein
MFIQNQENLNAIRQTALDYIQGWYDCDETRAAKALHPDLVKRFIDKNNLHGMGINDMLGLVRKQEGEKFKGDRQIKITILDVFNDIAAVKIESAEYSDYAHLGKINGNWVIINVLWGFKNACPRSCRGRRR